MSSITLLKPYLHNGLSVEVPFTSEAFFNATIAAKPFGKVPKNWLRTEETQAYIQAIGRKCPIEQHQLVRVVSGAPETGGGTWLHPKLGIAFARWLDADFCVWCDEQIEAILRRDLSVIAQPKIYAVLRPILRDIGQTRDAFVRQGLINLARPLFAALGVPMPSIALAGKPVDQMQLEV